MSKHSPALSNEVSVPEGISPPNSSASAIRPHELECLIQRELQSRPGLKFSRLTVHQCDQGVCLEGLLETNDEGLDLCELVEEIAGVKAINHVVIRPVTPK